VLSSVCESVAELTPEEFEPAVAGATVATATDVAGNVSAPAEQTIVSVSGNFNNDNDWFNGGGATPDVTITTTGVLAERIEIDLIAGEQTIEYTGQTIADGVYTGIVVRVDGDEQRVPLEEFPLKIDTVAPAVSRPTGLLDSYTRGQTAPTLTCVATDLGGSELESCTIVTGVDTATVTPPGQPRFVVVTATDVAGNTATAQFPYTVVEPACDPRGDVPRGFEYGDVVGCIGTRNPAGTQATLILQLAAPIPMTRPPQYRLLLSSSATGSSSLVRWQGSTNDRAVLSATVAPDRLSLTFVIDLARVGVSRTQTLFWRAEVQDGAPAQQNVGFLDYAPNVGLPRLTVAPL
jgi:hypothetical protein